MAEVLVLRIWNGKIGAAPCLFSKMREKYQKALEEALDAEMKKLEEGKIPDQEHIEEIQMMRKKLRQIDMALEGRFNLIVIY